MNEINKKKLQIGGLVLDGVVGLAPMAGVSDLAYRLLAKEQGASLVCTEMVSAMGINYNNEHTVELLRMEEIERPVSLQIFGSDIVAMVKAAQVVETYGADILDINMGCPVKKVVTSGDGSALMKTPDLAAAITEAVVKAVKIPVTVKMRLGWDEAHRNVVEFAKKIEAAGAAAIAVHGRTKEQMYSGTADWSYIKKVKKNVKIPVLGNGDVIDPFSAEKLLLETGCDGILIGRAAQGNPWIFNRVRTYLEKGILLPEPKPEEKLDMLTRHFHLLATYKGKQIALKEIRTHAGWYLKGLKEAARWRNRFNTVISEEMFLHEIEQYREFLVKSN